MKKYLTILFSLMFIVSFTIPLFASAVIPTISLKLGAQSQNTQTAQWAWVLSLETTNIPDGGIVTMVLSEKTTEIKEVNRVAVIIKNNKGEYHTDNILYPETTYYVTPVYNGASYPQYAAITPKGVDRNINGTPADRDTVIGSDTPVTVTPKKDSVVSNSNSDYTLLAPIGDKKIIKYTDNIGDYFNIIFKIAIGLCAVLAVVMIVIGGIQYMGDESVFGKTEAKSQITKAILGLLIAIGSYALLNTINPAMLGTSGLNIKQVSAEIQDETETVPWEGTSGGDNSALCPEGYINVATSGSPSSINVCKSISANLTKLLAAAKDSNIILSGSGSRTKAEQQALRVQNGCASEALSSSKCTPPTAQPGHSMHESGMAVDFKCNGRTMMASGGKTSACFIWLDANAGSYGFKNLSSEPWHWSAGPKAGH